ncbi:MAG: YggT family protein [Cyanobacteria bacterium J06614_10]
MSGAIDSALVTLILSVVLGLYTLLFLFRIILTWYPEIELNTLPWAAIAWPTEPFLVPVRKLVPPIGGVDISPIIWVGIVSFLREILVGQQGLMRMM